MRKLIPWLLFAVVGCASLVLQESCTTTSKSATATPTGYPCCNGGVINQNQLAVSNVVPFGGCSAGFFLACTPCACPPRGALTPACSGPCKPEFQVTHSNTGACSAPMVIRVTDIAGDDFYVNFCTNANSTSTIVNGLFRASDNATVSCLDDADYVLRVYAGTWQARGTLLFNGGTVTLGCHP